MIDERDKYCLWTSSVSLEAFFSPNAANIVQWPGPAGELMTLSRPLALLRGPAFKWRGGEMRRKFASF